MGSSYLHGGAFSLAAIAVVAMAGYLNLRRPELLKENYFQLSRYLQELQERATLAQTVPPNLPVMV